MMIRTIALGLALATGAPLAAQDDGNDAAPTEGEAKLARMLEGRVAGEPQNCIPMRPHADLTVIDRTALVYEVGQTLYVNVTRDPRRLDDNDTLVRRTSIPNRLCSTEIITKIDRFHGAYTGNVSLGEFIPYRKADS